MNEKELLKGAISRMKLGQEPTREDWFLLMELVKKKLYLPQKKKVRDYLLNHLKKHKIDEFNEDEKFVHSMLMMKSWRFGGRY